MERDQRMRAFNSPEHKARCIEWALTKTASIDEAIKEAQKLYKWVYGE